jgi:hypothetical protein
VKTLVKWLLFILLVVCAMEFTLKGERGAFGGALVKMGMVAPGESSTLKDRIEQKLDKAKDNEARQYGEIDKAGGSGD